MAVLSRCPPSGQLVDLVNGAAEPAEEENLLTHLEGCGDCQHLLDELMGASPDLLEAARQVGAGHRTEDGEVGWEDRLTFSQVGVEIDRRHLTSIEHEPRP